MSGPLARGAAVLSPETIAALKAEIAKPDMNADKLRKRLVPPVSGATFHRALRGYKVSLPVQAACKEMARELGRGAVIVSKIEGSPEGGAVVSFVADPAYDFDPDPEAA